MAQHSLERLAAQTNAAQARLYDAIRQEHHNGSSLRTIAKLTGMSHEKVRQIVSR